MKTILSLFVAVIFSALSTAAQPCTMRLTGHVHSTATHENLANATVTLVEAGRTVVTDSKGDFRFDSLCSGSYTLSISHASYALEVRTINLNRNFHVDIDLLPAVDELQEVTITGVRQQGPTGIKKELGGRALEETRGGSFAEALSQITGVTLLQTGSTVAKPVIHGLHSNRILTINNGVRQEGQQWGNEHAPEIDPFIANKLTVIKGVDVLRYGSDAVGGVILVEPKALRGTPGYNAELNTVYATNNRQYVASAIFEQQMEKFPALTYRLQGTLKKGANIATPHYRLNNTALSERNFSAMAGYKKEHFNTELYYSFFKNKVGIFTGAHIGNITDLLAAIESARPDEVHTGDNTYAIDRPYQDVRHQLLKWKTGFDINNQKFNILLSAQHNHRKEFDMVRNADARGAQINLSVLTLSEEVNWERPRRNNLQGVVGVVAMQQDNSYSGRYLIPNYNLNSIGGYALEKWNKGAWDAQAGIRYDYKAITTSRLQAGSQTYTSYDFNFSTLAGSLHGGYSIQPQWKVSASAALATRAPHVNELLTNGVHHGSGTYEVGNIHLKPERGINLSLNTHYTSPNNVLNLDATFYRNGIKNFIYQQPRPEEPVLTIRGAFPKIEYRSTDALLQGMDLTAGLQPIPGVLFTTKYALLRARNLATNDWLIGMPADRFTNELAYELKDGKHFSDGYISIEVAHVLEQKRFPDERGAKQDYKNPPAAYTLLNADLSATTNIGKVPVTIGISGRNLLNTVYRDYLNSFRYFTDEMGRNISLRLKINLTSI